MSSISEKENLIQRLQTGLEARSRFKENRIRELIASQIRMLREKNNLTQTELGERAGIKQSRISLLEDPDYSGIALRTLFKLSDAFDVGLVVQFAPFSDLVQYSTSLTPTDLAPPSFAEEQLSFAVMNPEEPTWFTVEMHEPNREILFAGGCADAYTTIITGAATNVPVCSGASYTVGLNAAIGIPVSETPEPDVIQREVYEYAVA